MKEIGMMNKRKIYVLTLLIMSILAAVFLNSFYWPYDGIDSRKLIVWGIAIGLIVIVPVLVVKIKMFYELFVSIFDSIKHVLGQLMKNKKKIIYFLLTIALGVILSRIAAQIFGVDILKREYNPKIVETFFVLYLILTISVFMWKTLAKRVECFFVIVALILGVFSISVTPNRVGVSWDDEVHYARTLEISNLLNGIMYIADERNINEYATNIYGQTGFDRASATQYEQELNTSYEFEEWNEHDFWEYGVWSVSYVPAAIGIILARGLEMSYVNVFNMGRLFNLLSYVLLIYLAMKRLKHGKMIVATIGLIPTTVFMAASYSYDWWVTGFTILGFAYFFAEFQEESVLKNRNIVIMIGALMLGCLPKAIYFPILFPLLFMPKTKFKDSKQRLWYYLFVIGMGVLLVASFMLPRFINGMGTGDSRGGTEVNASAQVMYILQNPFEFAKTLLLFLKFYVSPQSTGPMLQRMGYVGEGDFYGIVSLLIVVVAFLDRSDKNHKNYLVRITGVIGCIVALVLSTVALYISFTAVGADSVAGMQGRYMVPFIFPTLYCLGFGGTHYKISKNAFVCVPMLIIAVTFIYNMLRMCVIRY